MAHSELAMLSLQNYYSWRVSCFAAADGTFFRTGRRDADGRWVFLRTGGWKVSQPAAATTTASAAVVECNDARHCGVVSRAALE